MTENDRLRALPLEDRLRIAAVNLALTGAPRALVVVCWRAAELLEQQDRSRASLTPVRSGLVETRHIPAKTVASPQSPHLDATD
ncbi:MAG: hypothetical protein ACM3NS_06340 [Deltaproteobacteria bacterium]